ncbi:MAG: flagellar export chaperone FliS [Burkholderiales bacterium]
MFSANSRAAISSYRNVGIETGVSSASPQRLILMLYEGAIAAIAAAQHHLRLKNIGAKGEAISKAISIIDGGLKASLDLSVGGELAQNLSGLYVYMGQRLLQANIKNDPAGFEEVRQLLQQLMSAWETLAATTTTTAAAAQPGAMPQPRRAATSYGSI